DAARASTRTSRRRDPRRRGQDIPATLVGRGGTRDDLASLDLALGSRDGDGLPHDARPPGGVVAAAAPARAARSVSVRTGSAPLDARPVQVRPLVLVAVPAHEERRRRPGALVVGFRTLAVVPRRPVGIGGRLAGLVAAEVLEVLGVAPTG